MRVNIGCVRHGRNNIFDSRGTQKAKVHLKLVLEKYPEVKGLRSETSRVLGKATYLQNLEGMIDSIDAIG